MDETERALFAAELDATFRGDFAEDREAAIMEHLGAVQFDVTRALIARLVFRGQVFMPTASELVDALRGMSRSGWDFRRLLAGRTVEQQLAEDRAEVRRALAVRRVPGVLGP